MCEGSLQEESQDDNWKGRSIVPSWIIFSLRSLSVLKTKYQNKRGAIPHTAPSNEFLGVGLKVG